MCRRGKKYFGSVVSLWKNSYPYGKIKNKARSGPTWKKGGITMEKTNCVYMVSYMPEPEWEKVPAVELTHTGWLEPCAITAQAKLCRDDNSLWVRMEAVESPIRATLTGKLDQVCNDSCLEFFFAPLEGDKRYFNFEFNPLGTMYLGFGAERPTRVRQIVKKPEELFRPAPFHTEKGWGLVFRIPAEFVALYFPGYAFRGESGANFYKCGDRTETPHYLAWAPLTSPTPDFHRRQDFGKLRFA